MVIPTSSPSRNEIGISSDESGGTSAYSSALESKYVEDLNIWSSAFIPPNGNAGEPAVSSKRGPALFNAPAR